MTDSDLKILAEFLPDWEIEKIGEDADNLVTWFVFTKECGHQGFHDWLHSPEGQSALRKAIKNYKGENGLRVISVHEMYDGEEYDVEFLIYNINADGLASCWGVDANTVEEALIAAVLAMLGGEK